jgi:nucleoside-diphosphate-sugar epimerase
MFGGLRLRVLVHLLCLAPILHLAPLVSSLNTVAVFGGSGFIGRRVCRQLVESGQCEAVVSISRSGRPPSYYCDGPWVDSVQWISYDLDKDWTDTDGQEVLRLPALDAAISCIGNVNPKKEWTQLFGLGFDDDRLRFENGVINERAIELAELAGAKRFAFVSVSYETAKTLEGPIVGYMDGKRMCEFLACDKFGEDNTVLIGPSLVYGGRRFPKLGRIYRSFVESPPARAYVAGNDFATFFAISPQRLWRIGWRR